MSIKKFFDLYYSDALNAYYKIRDNYIRFNIFENNTLIILVIELKNNVLDITGRVISSGVEEEIKTLTRESDEN